MLMSHCVRIIPRLSGIERALRVLCQTTISHDNFESHWGALGPFFFDQTALLYTDGKLGLGHSPIT